ncbi:MAG: SRPBCC family protein [Saprospiraceae bacterium]|nr:SRPBCC family protein [Saprospiraceae bacterium]
MKILRYALLAVVAIVLLFFAVGLFNPSIQYGHEITVEKPVEEVWAIVQDESKYDQWLEGYQGMELIEGRQNEVGSKYKVVVDPGEGQAEFEMIQTLKALEEFNQVHLHYDSDFMDMDQHYTFSESNGQTTFSTQADVRPKGMMMRSMFALMEMLSGSFTAQETKNIEALKKVIEANTTDYYPAPAVAEEEMGAEAESE